MWLAMSVAVVSGTNGKTTTAFLLRAILDAAGRRPGLVGTVEWEVGGQRHPAPFTTPEASRCPVEADGSWVIHVGSSVRRIADVTGAGGGPGLMTTNGPAPLW